MADAQEPFEFDVFVSYRWAEPDQSWVRDALVPALQAAGLKVCLDVNDFKPGRDLMLEMSRAGQTSRRALCILSDHYFAGNRMVHFESLLARRMDPGGVDSRLVPLVLRATSVPDWLAGLIPVDWTDEKNRAREWGKVLSVLQAPGRSRPPGAPIARASPTSDASMAPADWPMATPVFLHDYNLPREFVAREGEMLQLKQLLAGGTASSTASRVVAVTAIGGVGKSCLCRALIERPDIATAFRKIVWFSFYETRSATEEHFFREVLQRGFDWQDAEPPREGAAELKRLREALCRVLDAADALLVLDGLEVIQFADDPASAGFGGIKPTWSETDKLLRHVLNAKSSVCLISSRVPLRPLETLRGYYSVSLDLFQSGDGAQVLRSLGVEGKPESLEACAKNLGGHALSLVAAGRFMARRKIAASRLADLTGDADLFRRTPEGEKVERICAWYRSELSAAQQHFLTRLSLHGRAVTAGNYPVLIADYRGRESDCALEEAIIQPLVERGLVDRLEGADSTVRFSAHPLMKLAFSTWLEPETRKRAHEDWARAAAAAPGLFFHTSEASSQEELQPLIDATEQYLAADNWREAWEIYCDRDLGNRLGQLGYLELALRLAREFEEVRVRSNEWTPNSSVVLLDRLAWLCNRLDKTEEQLAFRRKELAVARQGQVSALHQVEAIVTNSLAHAGFVREAAEIQSLDRSALAAVALAEGRYGEAETLLQTALRGAWGHERTTTMQSLAEAQYRQGRFDAAAAVLADGLELARAKSFTCCEMAILTQLRDLALRRDNLPAARHWSQTLAEVHARLNLPEEPSSWMLLAEGDLVNALASADECEVGVPSASIRRRVSRARVLAAQGLKAEAEVELDAAEREGALHGYGQLNNDLAILRRKIQTA